MRFTIEGYAFTIPDRHQPGDVLSEIEAHALNSFRVRNIQIQMLRKVRQAISQSSGQILSPEELASLQSQIAKYAESYQFSLPTRQNAITPLELEIEIVAKEMADKQARLKDWTSPGADPATIEQFKSLPVVQIEARRRLEDSKSLPL